MRDLKIQKKKKKLLVTRQGWSICFNSTNKGNEEEKPKFSSVELWNGKYATNFVSSWERVCMQ